VQALIRAYPTSVPRMSEIAIDLSVLFFALGVSMANKASPFPTFNRSSISSGMTTPVEDPTVVSLRTAIVPPFLLFDFKRLK